VVHGEKEEGLSESDGLEPVHECIRALILGEVHRDGIQILLFVVVTAGNSANCKDISSNIRLVRHDLHLPTVKRHGQRLKVSSGVCNSLSRSGINT
jgi:hypothetical protein